MLPPFDPWRTGAAMLAVAHGTLASPNELASLRTQRLADLLVAARRSPFFKAAIGERAPAGLHLADLPITRKADLMRRFGEWLTVPDISLDEVRAFMADPGNIGQPFMGRFMVWESSGSHGEPGIFIQDAAALAVYDSLEFLRRSMPRPVRSMFDPWSVAEHKVFIGATDGHFASTVSIERLRRWNPVMARTMHSLSFMQPVACLNAQLHDIAPAVIATYPSVAVMLAEEHLAGRLRIAPREIWTGGETLTPGMRSLIAEAFDCAVVNNYGASEFMSLAWQCLHGSLHLNSDWVILEAVDEDGRPAPSGTAGATTLLTNLANHVQPIIRYDLGDRVAVHEAPCACGTHLPVISVEGRSGDVLLLGDKEKGTAKVSSLALSSVLEAIEELPEFQLIQQAPDELELRTELQTPPIDAVLGQARLALQDFIRHQGALGVHIHCHGGRPPRRTRNGKVQRIIALQACHQQ